MLKTCNPRAGYTIVEMTIVALVMSIFAAVAAPLYHSTLTKYQLDLAGKRIQADFRFTQSEALRTSQSRTMQFNTATNSYSISNVTDLDRSADTYAVSLGDDPLNVVLVAAVFNGDANVVFNRFGRPDSNGTVTFRVGTQFKTVLLSTDGTATSL